MQITSVKIRKVFTPKEGKGPVKCIASITIDGCFAVHDIKIIEREDGKRYIAMPSRKSATGIYQDICHPINAESRAFIETYVFDEFDKVSEKNES